MTGCTATDQYAPLTGMVDAFGNEVRYEYQQLLPNECDLVRITWGQNANAGLQDFARVDFSYKFGQICNGVYTNTQSDYRSGVPRVTGGALLQAITAKAYAPGAPTSVVHTRTVSLNYDATSELCTQQHGPVRLLTSIQETASGADSPFVSLPAVTFDYNSPTVTLGPPQSIYSGSPWLGGSGPRNLGWGFRRNDDRWPTVESMFLDVDGDGLQDLVLNEPLEGQAIQNCSALWYRNAGLVNNQLSFGYGGRIDLPRLKWRGGAAGQVDSGAATAGREATYGEGCALNGQSTAFKNSLNNSMGGCHDPANPSCAPSTDPANPLEYCFPGGTHCPPDVGGAPGGQFQTYLAYRWMDMDSDGLPDLVAAVHGDIDYYDVERGNMVQFVNGEPPISSIPGVGQWPACDTRNHDTCYQLTDCFEMAGVRTCDELGCSIDWDRALECITNAPTTGCDSVMYKPAGGPDGVPSLGVKRSPYERCEGLYPWLIYKNLGKGAFDNKPTIKYQPVPLESSNGDSSFNGPTVTSEDHRKSSPCPVVTRDAFA